MKILKWFWENIKLAVTGKMPADCCATKDNSSCNMN